MWSPMQVKKLPTHILKKNYSSLSLSYLNYNILAWGTACKKLIPLQKKAIRLIVSAKYNAHTEPLFKKLSILKVEDLFECAKLKLIFKYTNNLVPDFMKSLNLVSHCDIHNYNTRYNQQIVLPHLRTNLAKNTTKYNLSQTINNYPRIILDKCETHSLDGYKLYCKNYFIKTYQETCTIQNCYICNRNEPIRI